MQAGQVRPSIVDVPADGRVGPLATAVAVEPQVQKHQQGDRFCDILGEPQRRQPFTGHVAPDHLVVVEGDTTTGDVPPGSGLADVVQQGGPAQYLVRAALGQRVLQRDRLAQHGQGVGVDVLVLVVLIDLHPQRGQLRQDDVRDPDVHEPLQPDDRVGREHEFAQLVPDTLDRYDHQPGSSGTHRHDQLGDGGQPELGFESGGPQDAQRVVVQGGHWGTRGPQHCAREVRHAAEQVDELMAGHGHGHGVHGEVTAGEVALEGVTVGNSRVPGCPIIGFGAVGGHLEPHPGTDQPDGSERDPGLPDSVRPVAGNLKDTFRPGIGGKIKISSIRASAQATEQRVPNRTTDEIQAVTGAGKEPPQVIRGSRYLEKGADRPLRGVTWIIQADH